ncbi:hypothetical protein D7X74_03850 [Corallococcus sp. CA047B]|uniref:hypothetical protein n=1 Tax=Corallococcus sp. CA047B TaxID=2316729 RepID=UPI000EA37958|nr:hypothetical protein [Corallococcus sp. CA047B]RKH20565.1 hypothetical protein D7X74_03850 [Corallococcus sp. CA047B]
MNALRWRCVFSPLLMSLPLALAGCGPEFADVEGYTEIACTRDRPHIDDLRISPVPDAFLLYSIGLKKNSTEPPSVFLSATRGEPCATATDVATCQAAVEEARATSGFHRSCYHGDCSEYFALTTRGDEVKLYTTVESLRELLGTVDTEQEAVFLAYAADYAFLCDKVDQGGVKANPDGSFNVIGYKYSDCGEGPAIVQYVTQVSATGEVRELEHHVMRHYKSDCSLDMSNP